MRENEEGGLKEWQHYGKGNLKNVCFENRSQKIVLGCVL